MSLDWNFIYISASCLSGWVKCVLKNPLSNSSVHNQHIITTKIKEDLNQENKAALSSILVLVTKTSYKALPWYTSKCPHRCGTVLPLTSFHKLIDY